MSFGVVRTSLILSLAIFASAPVSAQRSAEAPYKAGELAPKLADERPAELKNVGIEEHLGRDLDLNIKVKTETGEEVTLGSFFDGKTPVIISPVYYACPGLCNFHLNGLIEALKEMDWSVGTKFKVLAVSFDAKETPDLAAAKKETYLKVYDRAGTESGWSFLTADAENVAKFTENIGFKFSWNETEQEWAHASAAIVVSPKGVITRYLPGIVFEPKDVRLAILEAGEGKVGTFVDNLVLYCFQYNPHQSRYTVYAFNIMKLGGAATVLLLALWLLPVWVRSRRHATARRS